MKIVKYQPCRGNLVMCIKPQNNSYLIVRIVHQRGFPLALVLRIIDHGTLPHPAARSRLTGWVRDLRRLPFSIHLLVPKETQRQAVTLNHSSFQLA